MENERKYLNLKVEMVRAGVKRKELAKMLGITNWCLNSKLNGLYDWKTKEINFICDYFKKTYEELFR